MLKIVFPKKVGTPYSYFLMFLAIRFLVRNKVEVMLVTAMPRKFGVSVGVGVAVGEGVDDEDEEDEADYEKWLEERGLVVGVGVGSVGVSVGVAWGVGEGVDSTFW
jgi:hypothetical protein